MTEFKLGDEVVLTHQYNGYPRGTKGIFLEFGYSSGYHVPTIVIPDERLSETLELGESSTLKELVEKRQGMGEVGTMVMQTYLTTLKPDKHMITTKDMLEEKLKDAQSKVLAAENDLKLFVI